MTEQIKMGMKLLRYTFGIKTCLVSMVLFLGLGILCACLPVRIMGRMSGFFILLVSLWVVQMLSSLNVSYMVQASPWKRALQTSVPALLSFVCSLILYLFVVLISVLKLRGAALDERQILVEGVLMNGILAFLLLVYSGVAYKYFRIATVVFSVTVYALMCVFEFIPNTGKGLNLSFMGAVGIGILCIIAGALAEYGLSLLFYKVPVSKGAQMHGLQKYM